MTTETTETTTEKTPSTHKPFIPLVGHNASQDTLCEQLLEHGAIVVTGICSDTERSKLIAELEPFLAKTTIQTSDDPDEFYPANTKRAAALVRKSKTVQEMITNPSLMDICKNILLPNCERFQLHVSSALVIGPGARKQILHREDDPFEFFQVPRPNMVVASMWAMTDFTIQNGATLIVPGSHRWEAGREAQPHEITSAQMKAGDMLVWLGGTLHGAGENISHEWRYGIFLSYSLGWLRQEENQYIDTPLEIASTLPKPLQDLLGYKMHRGLGFFDVS
jgi:ectoine hydroxylase-related dioxygenase (phytanoyl-CoA dioxygenase family)